MTRKHKHIITINNIMSSKTTTSNISKNIILLKWFNFFLDLRFYSPIAVIYFAHITGSFVLGMSIFSVIMITQSVFELPMGIFSDNIGRKKTMIIGALFGVIGITSYAIGLSYAFLLLGLLQREWLELFLVVIIMHYCMRHSSKTIGKKNSQRCLARFHQCFKQGFP